MKHSIGLALALLAFVGATAQAAERKTYHLSYNEIAWIDDSIMKLDGADRVIKDGASEKIVREPYKLGPGLVLLLARDLTAIRAAMTDFQAAAKKLLDAGEPKAKIEAMGAEKTAIDLLPVSIKELGLEANKIAPSVLAGLAPILEE